MCFSQVPDCSNFRSPAVMKPTNSHCSCPRLKVEDKNVFGGGPLKDSDRLEPKHMVSSTKKSVFQRHFNMVAQQGRSQHPDMTKQVEFNEEDREVNQNYHTMTLKLPQCTFLIFFVGQIHHLKPFTALIVPSFSPSFSHREHLEPEDVRLLS